MSANIECNSTETFNFMYHFTSQVFQTLIYTKSKRNKVVQQGVSCNC